MQLSACTSVLFFLHFSPQGNSTICVTDFLVDAVCCLHRHIFVTRRKIMSYISRLIPQHTFRRSPTFRFAGCRLVKSGGGQHVEVCN